MAGPGPPQAAYSQPAKKSLTSQGPARSGGVVGGGRGGEAASGSSYRKLPEAGSCKLEPSWRLPGERESRTRSWQLCALPTSDGYAQALALPEQCSVQPTRCEISFPGGEQLASWTRCGKRRQVRLRIASSPKCLKLSLVVLANALRLPVAPSSRESLSAEGWLVLRGTGGRAADRERTTRLR